MTVDRSIGIIGGNGWLGNAIASALVLSGTAEGARMILSGRTERRGRLEVPGATYTRDNRDLVDQSEVVILSVRPEDFAEIDIDASGKLVVSVMAGVTARSIADQTGAVEVVRAIPNAAASIRRSFTPWFALPAVSEPNKRIVQTLFDACGEAAEVPQEEHIDYCAAMTGSGAAFSALLAEALRKHAVASGLPADFALRAAKGVVAGASQLFASASDDTGEVVDAMIDYRGMTAAALITMREQGFDQAVGAGLDAALRKAATLTGS